MTGSRDWVEPRSQAAPSWSVDGRGGAAEVPGLPPGRLHRVQPSDEVSPDMEIAQEEVFGPVLCVIRTGSLDEAIEVVNASRFGNGTSIFTESGASWSAATATRWKPA